MKKVAAIFIVLFLVYTSGNCQQTLVGLGFSPIHRSVQSDFKPNATPLQFRLSHFNGHWGIKVESSWNSEYTKDRFSFRHKTYELNAIYRFNRSFQALRINPYLSLGINSKQTSFTTEGYPGITGYELKIEEENNLGAQFKLGAFLPLKKVVFHIEGAYFKNSPAAFIAGGFSPQKLVTDHWGTSLGIGIPIHISSQKRRATACPNL